MMNQPQNNRNHQKKVLLGMSGGVDSSVSLFLLQEMGYEVIGLTLLTTDAGFALIPDVKEICRQAKADHIIADVRQNFQETIIDDFIKTYLQGRTPNPCILCNPVIKFATLFSEANRLDCEYIATGHYASMQEYKPTGRLALTRSAAGIKDQTYFLYRLTQEQLGRIMFPLAGMDKVKTRNRAGEMGITSLDGQELATKQDSQDNCFIGSEGYAEFIRRKLISRGDTDSLRLWEPGPVLDISGSEIGTHSGLIHYTVGQRKGFNVRTSDRLFVIEKQIAANALVVGTYDKIMKKRIRVVDPVYSGMALIEHGTRLEARIRYSAHAVPCTVDPQEDGSLLINFDEPAAAPAPGQSCVFYRDGQVMAGGYIGLPDTAFLPA